ncbi:MULTISPECIES: hypothetical protein [unclassified Pseudoxanthomonas]|uniref:hypothetical protein n=1 Tax=unclassified Pseudoxanthomonas TaxID=2645906 RepID=UPI003078528A
MTIRPTRVILVALSLSLAACGKTPAPAEQSSDAPATRVQATGKQAEDPANVPADVLAAAKAARPQLQVTAVEHEQRDGNDYYDVAGLLDGAELELDITRVDGKWTVVEVQRDIIAEQVPAPVAAVLASANPTFKANRIIESDQGNGIVIYEFFGPGENDPDTKIEVKAEGSKAEVLTSEWVH